MTPDELLADFGHEWSARRPPRKFAAGLLIALVRMVRHLGVSNQPCRDADDFFRRHPRSPTTQSGARANTLFVQDRAGTLVGLRSFYDAAEHLIRVGNRRFDYPTCAPHATQVWSDYERWIDALVRLDADALDRIEGHVLVHVLRELPSHDRLAAEPPPARPFTELLTRFDFTAQRGERTGAAYQGAVYAYVRADAPHLQVEVSRVRAGSKRRRGVGDVDGWEGRRLMLSAEVKHLHLNDAAVARVAAFAASVGRRGAIGIVVAESFSDGARADLAGLGVRTLDRDDLIRLVDVWDPVKQQAALSAFAYYVHHVEQSGPLVARLDAFTGR